MHGRVMGRWEGARVGGRGVEGELLRVGGRRVAVVGGGRGCR